MGVDQKELDKISEWFNKSNLTSATIEYNKAGDYKITLSREQLAMPHPHVMHTTSFNPHIDTNTSGNDNSEGKEGTNTTNKDVIKVTSPIVGTFYRSPGPDSLPFAQVGGIIKKGNVICILEAMKVMNELEAEFDMEILSVAVDNGGLVEFGQVLFEVKAL